MSIMNIQLLPKEIQDLIGEYNVDHRPKMKMVLNELLKKQNKKTHVYVCLCRNCGLDANEKYTKYIFWEKHTFCSEQCQYIIERRIRRIRY